MCAEGLGFSTFATQRNKILGEETGAYGSLIISSKARGNVLTLQDIKGKKIAAGVILGAGGYILPYKVGQRYEGRNTRCLEDSFFLSFNELISCVRSFFRSFSPTME